MTDRVHVGTMLIADGTPMPESIAVATEAYRAGWASVIGFTSAALDKKIESAGWTFFYMAGEIRARGFGQNDKVRTDRAMGQITVAVKRERCNCLEVTEVRQRSFLGLRYTSVVAHSRHIQESRIFHDSAQIPAGRRSTANEWLYNQTPESLRPAA